jgi:hypothetical protein
MCRYSSIVVAIAVSFPLAHPSSIVLHHLTATIRSVLVPVPRNHARLARQGPCPVSYHSVIYSANLSLFVFCVLF